jgi:hypothetical protein
MGAKRNQRFCILVARRVQKPPAELLDVPEAAASGVRADALACARADESLAGAGGALSWTSVASAASHCPAGALERDVSPSHVQEDAHA